MRFLKTSTLLKYLLITLLLSFQTCIAYESSSCKTVIHHIETSLPRYGILEEGLFKIGTTEKNQKFVYLKVDNAYIHDLIRLIQADGFEEPPYFNDNDLVGAHITVIYPDEMQAHGIETIQECGQIYFFTPNGCNIVHPLCTEIDQAYLVTIEAPALDALRAKYGLPKSKYDFHITIGIIPASIPLNLGPEQL